jgi:hypothetical protein
MPELKPDGRRSRLRDLLDRPEARPRVTQAVARLLGVTIAAIGVIGVLVIWHLVRRGRLIRNRLRPPRATLLPEPEAGPDLDLELDPEPERDSPR